METEKKKRKREREKRREGEKKTRKKKEQWATCQIEMSVALNFSVGCTVQKSKSTSSSVRRCLSFTIYSVQKVLRVGRCLEDDGISLVCDS